MKRRPKDQESIHAASRKRMQTLGTAVIPAPTTIPPHTHSADQITFEPYNLLEGDDLQETGQEHDDEKLARSGVQPMQGDLNMDDGLGPWEIDNIKNLNMSGGVGAAILNLVRNIVMTGIGWIENVKRIHFIGDDDDGDALIDGLERVVFNNEPTKSVIENPSTIEFNPAVTPGSDTTYLEGQTSWSDVERMLQADSSHVDQRNTLGWVEERWWPNAETQPMRAVYSNGYTDGAPDGYLFDISDWDPTDPWQLPPFAVSKHFAPSSESDLWVMRRGILRDVPLGSGWAAGDFLWASGVSGEITNVPPTYQNAPHILVGRVMRSPGGGVCDVHIDVRVFPRAEVLPANVGRRWSWMIGE